MWVGTMGVVLIPWLGGPVMGPGDMDMRVSAREIGAMGTGTNMFRTGLVHSSGVVFIGTYGPAPAIIWKYDPQTQALTKVGAPGEYQLDSMVEGPNGKVYIGTAYSGIVYELDPTTGEVRNLRSPPVDSTAWIFTMIRTREGEIYGAKGVGLFHLDWRTGRMESCGIVPGEHTTPGPGSSGPIVRTFEERPDGVLWGDTNRWIFTFDPGTRKIDLVADIAAVDEACYAVIHGLGPSPVQDLYFQVYPRWAGRKPRRMFGVCRAETRELEFFDLEGVEGDCMATGWWMDGAAPRWLVAQYEPDGGTSSVAVVDVEQRRVIDRWQMDGRGMPPMKLAGEGLWFISGARGTLLRGEPAEKRLVAAATNPTPAECRCLAAAPDGRLGTDTYDCGFVFTRHPTAEEFTDHGRVWFDDHRCNYGPAAFAGVEGRYFLANHGEGMSRLWVTDVRTSRHWPVGEAAMQLVRFRDGSVWGTTGPNPPAMAFDPQHCWTPGWCMNLGPLFRYRPGAAQVETWPDLGLVGPIAEAPGAGKGLIACSGDLVRVCDGEGKAIAEERTPAPVVGATTDRRRQVTYLVLADGQVLRGQGEVGALRLEAFAMGFGRVDRGCFVLARSGRLAGLTGDGSVTLMDPKTGTVTRERGPAPLPAGPAVDPEEDAWYFADRTVVRYEVEG